MRSFTAQHTPFVRLGPWLCCCLVLLAGLPAVDAAPPTEPLPAPHYSFDRVSPAVTDGHVIAHDILQLQFPYPEPAVLGTIIGLHSLDDDIDALSAANADVDVDSPFLLLFSVDRLSVGTLGPDEDLLGSGVPYNMHDQAVRGHAAGDEFIATGVYTRTGRLADPTGISTNNNFLARNNYDEGGVDFSARPDTHASTILQAPLPEQDRVDATAYLDAPARDGVLPRVYFSLTADSPSLPWIHGAGPAGGASIFCAHDGASWMGACCHPDGSCVVMPMYDCPGMWLGPDTDCAECNQTPGPFGACCHLVGECELTPEDGCMSLWMGPLTSCDMCPSPPLGACCYFGGACEITFPMECHANSGNWIGPGTGCEECNMPPETGACCYPNGMCEVLPGFDCWGTWMGPETPCDLCDGGDEGACCLPGGECYPLSPHDCSLARGEFRGGPCLGDNDGNQIDDACEGGVRNPTQRPCCLPDDQCVMLTPQECYGLGGFITGGYLCLGDANTNGIDDACEPDEPENALYVEMYASFAELGLHPDDDIDALTVFDTNENGRFDGSDQVMFSLAPGSPSLALIPDVGAAPGAAIFAVTPVSPPHVLILANQLGLGAATDNIDALNFWPWDTESRATSEATSFGIQNDRGDLNCDGEVNFRDIDPFVTALTGQSAYAAEFGLCPWINADCNQDQTVNFRDIDAFVGLLVVGNN